MISTLMILILGVSRTNALCDQLCDACSPQLQECLVCREGYGRNYQNQCIQQTVKGCQIYDNDGKCVFCFDLHENIDDRCVRDETGCIVSLGIGVCQQCMPNMQLLNNKCQGILHCATYLQNNTCQSCAEGYSLNNNICNDNSAGCLQINQDNGACIRCRQGYELIGYRCIPSSNIIPYCRLYSSQSMCVRCVPGFEVDSDGRCKMIRFTQIEGCVRQMDGQCQECEDGLVQLDGGCVKPMLGCLVLGQEDQCLICSKYFMRTEQRKCKDLYCIENENGPCSKCQSGYTFSNVHRVCMDPNCSSWFVDGRCIDCLTGYYIPYNGRKCQPNIANCEIMNPRGTCNTCDAGYDLIGGVCIRKQQKISGCINQQGQQCLTCSTGRFLKDNQCLNVFCRIFGQDPCTECIEGFIKNEDGTCVDPYCDEYMEYLCAKCFDGYGIDRVGKCDRLPPFCSVVNDDGGCSQCKEGYELDSNECRQIIFIPNCAEPDRSKRDQCLICNDRYYINQGKCTRVSNLCMEYNTQSGFCFSCKYGLAPQNGSCFDRNCQQYNGDGQCIGCSGMYKLSNSICQNVDPNCAQVFNQRCQKCVEEHFLSSGGECQKTPSNCLVVSFVNGFCTECLNGYRLNNGKCEDPNCLKTGDGQCDVCSFRYYYNGNKCSPVNPLCKDYIISGQCSTCYSSFILNEGNCIEEDPNCKVYNEGECSQCYDGYYVRNGKCNLVNPLCKTYNPQTGQCLSCYGGYRVREGGCVVFLYDVNCRLFDKDFNCFQCAPRHFIQNNKCIPVSPSCRDYHKGTGACTQCYDGYRVNGRQCVKWGDPHCVSFREQKCTACESGYTLGGQGCISTCLQVVNGKCVVCVDNYLITHENICREVDPQCKTYDLFNGCIKCYDGYLLSTKNRCYNPRLPSSKAIPFCALYSESDKCIECIDGHYLKEGQCKAVSILCGTYNKQNGKCLSCSSEYFNLQNGECIQLNTIVRGCSRYEGPFCVECELGYYYELYSCQQIDPNCLEYDYERNQCVRCGESLQVRGKQCI